MNKEYVFVGTAQLKTRDYIKQLEKENKQLKQDIKNIINIINNNCSELTTTESEFESLKRWNE